MSTNFYVREASVNTETGERVFEDTHVGKRSGGWTFMFQGSETRTVQGWRDRMAAMPVNMQVVDEYGAPYTPEEFWAAVEATTKPWGPKSMEPKTQRTMGEGREMWVNEGFSFAKCEFC